MRFENPKRVVIPTNGRCRKGESRSDLRHRSWLFQFGRRTTKLAVLVTMTFMTTAFGAGGPCLLQAAVGWQDNEPMVEVDDALLGDAVQPGALPLKSWEVDPAAEPALALKYRFHLDDEDRVEGNAVHAYTRAVMIASDNKEGQLEYYDRFEVWLEQPITDETAAEMQEWFTRYDSVLKEVARATRCRDCVWDYTLRENRSATEAFMLLLPEIQGLRQLARILQVRAIYEIHQHDYEAAAESIRQLYDMGFDALKTPLLVSSLVGSAIVGMANSTVERLIAAPDSPNLYWALMTLPEPLINIRPAVRYELGLVFSGFEYLQNPETVSRTKEGWNRVMAHDFTELLSMTGGSANVPEVQGRMMATGFAMRGFPIAKRALMESGYDEATLDEMPVAQVIAIHQSRLYSRLFDEVYRLAYRPVGEQFDSRQRVEAIMEELNIRNPGDSQNVEVFPFASLLMPAVSNAMQVPGRVQRHLEALKTVELLRMEMAKRDGVFPSSLDEANSVPVPRDPATGSPYPYELQDGTARLIVRYPKSIPSSGWGMVIELKRRPASSETSSTGK